MPKEIGTSNENGLRRHGVFGRTWSGKELCYSSVGEGNDLRVLAGGFSAADTVSPDLLRRWVSEAVRVAETGKHLGRFNILPFFEKITVCVIPDLNPDGREARKGLDLFSPFCDRVKKIKSGFPGREWTANIRGTDLKRNFRSGWGTAKMAERENGIFLPAPCGYGGEHPESELETASFCSFLRGNKPSFLCVFDDSPKGIYFGENGKNCEYVHKKAAAISEFLRIGTVTVPDAEVAATAEAWAENELSVPSFRVGLNGLSDEERMEVITLCAVL